MSEENKPNHESTPKNNKVRNLIIFFVLLIIVIQGINWYFHNQSKEKNLATQEELEESYDKIESLTEEMNEKIRQIDSLGGDISELTRLKEQLEEEREKLKATNRYTTRQLLSLKDRVEGYEELLKLKDEEIKNLKAVNEELLTENTGLKKDKIVLSDSISNLKTTREKLASKVAVASRLKAENIKVYAVNSRGKEREGEFKTRHIDKLKVSFNIAENEVAPVEGKEIIIRIIDDKNQVIFDVAKGSGTFEIGGKELFFTSSKEILFDNSRQQLTFVYDKGSDYAEGTYTLEVYTDDYLMGSEKFIVK